MKNSLQTAGVSTSLCAMTEVFNKHRTSPMVRLAAVLSAAAIWGAISSQAQPANDNFTNRIFLTGYNNDVPASTTGATVETGEPNKNLVSQQYASIWYSWTAPAPGTATVHFNTFDGYTRYLAAFTGTRLRSLHQLAPTDTSLVTFETKPGQVFQIQVMALPGTPDFDFELDLVPRPGNDNFTNRYLLEGTVVSTNGDSSAATREPAEPRNSLTRSLWYSWTAPASGWMFVDLTNGPPLVCVPYTNGSTIHTLRPVNSLIVTSNQYFSSVTPVAAGVTYDLTVGMPLIYGPGGGPFTFDLEFGGLTLTSPTNNSVLIGPPQIQLAASDLQPAFDGSIPSVTFYAVDMISNVVTELGQGDAPAFSLTWTNPFNNWYRIEARGTNSDGRVLRSNPAFIAVRPINDDFTNRLVLEGTNSSWYVNFGAATRAPNDPKVAKLLGDAFESATLWWTWTPQASGTATLSSGTYSLALSVYTGQPGKFQTVMPPCIFNGQFQALAGETYQILISDRHASWVPSQGNITLTETLQP